MPLFASSNAKLHFSTKLVCRPPSWVSSVARHRCAERTAQRHLQSVVEEHASQPLSDPIQHMPRKRERLPDWLLAKVPATLAICTQSQLKLPGSELRTRCAAPSREATATTMSIQLLRNTASKPLQDTTVGTLSSKCRALLQKVKIDCRCATRRGQDG